MTTPSALACLRCLFTPAGRTLLGCVTLAAAAAPAPAAGGTGAPVAYSWNLWFWLGYFSNAGSRGNVITLCVVIFCVSLLILMSATRRS